MRLIKRLGELLTGANSKPETRTEQSEWSRKTARSVEVTVETDEVIFQLTVNARSADAVPAEREQETSGQAEGASGVATRLRRTDER